MKKTLIAATAVALIIAGCGNGSDDSTAPGEPAETETPLVPMVYGDDPRFDRLYDDCSQGEVVACENLAFTFGDLPEDSEYTQYALEQLDFLLAAPPSDDPFLASTPTPETTSTAPAGFEDAFPVTIEYMDNGWSFAQTFYGGADLLGFSKEIENSPPGKAELVTTYSVIPQPDEDSYLIADVSEPISLDEGRTPPHGAGVDDPDYWLHFDGDPSETGLVNFTEQSNGLRVVQNHFIATCYPSLPGPVLGAEAQPNQVGWDCHPTTERAFGVALYGDGENREEHDESDVDLVLSQTDELFSFDKKSVVLRVLLSPYVNCAVQVFPNGDMQWWDDPDEDDDTKCLGFYKGTPENTKTRSSK